MLGWSRLDQPDLSISKYPPAEKMKSVNSISDQHFTLEEIAVLIEICKLREGGLEICGLEQSVVVEVRHAGILDRALVKYLWSHSGLSPK